jgi:DNA-binding transcriptional MerR regulator
MIDPAVKVQLPPIPAKRYFTIGEVSELCGVKPHVLRYWEQEFTQLKPVKRRGNRRYYQHHEVLLIRRIRELLYEQGFTISGARHRLDDGDFKDINHQADKSPNGKHANDLAQQVNLELPLTPTEHKAFDFAPIKAELRSVLNLLRSGLSAT